MLFFFLSSFTTLCSDLKVWKSDNSDASVVNNFFRQALISFHLEFVAIHRNNDLHINNLIKCIIFLELN